MAFTEFCCRSGGSNLNAGTRTGNSTEPGTSASFTYASGNWVASTGVFTAASGNPSTDGVAVGDFASVYVDGSTVTGFVGRVTAVTSTTITVSLTAKSGTAPTDGTGNRTLKIGGAWAGPSGTTAFPFGFIEQGMKNTTGNSPRVNLKNDQTYSITAAMTHTGASGGTQSTIVAFQGYTTSYGDGGKATIDGGTSGASYVLLTIAGTTSSVHLEDLCFQNNGATGSSDATSEIASAHRVVVNSVRGSGLVVASGTITECETYSCNQSNTAGKAGISLSAANAVRCIAHDNSGSNTDGFIGIAGTSTFVNCIADTNGRRGFSVAANFSIGTLIGCDAYNNGSHGITVSEGSTGRCTYVVENCNMVKNGGYGLQGSVSGNSVAHTGGVRNNGYGTGTQANTSGATNLPVSQPSEVSPVTYASGVTPWTDPANGDFRISLAAAKAAGRGSFTETQASYAGTVAYPDIGAAQHQDSGGSSGVRSVNIRGGADQ